MQALRILVAVVLLLSVSLSSAQQEDLIVSKEFPANIVCRRDGAQRGVERERIASLGGSETLYRACYLYEIDSADECILNLGTLQVNPIPSFPFQNSSVILVNTPLTSDRVYPPNTICFFVIGNKRDGFVYQYYEAIEQDVEGSLVIDTMSVGGIETMSVTDGTCQDFFEFRMKTRVSPREVLVTCGDQSDPRVRLGVDIAEALTFVFRSDGNSQEDRGVNITIIEINATAANLYGNDGTSRRKRSRDSEVVAPQGLEGLHGETGLRGAPGMPGKNGYDGRNGSLGIKGERGIEGVRGPEGPPGTEGKPGPTGLKGPHGPSGLPCHCPSLKHCTPGKQGEKGPRGTPGYRGDPGEKGARGPPGQPGPRGIPGQKGRKGSRGPKGYDGLNGAPGDQGPPGLRGQPGPVGPPGLGGCPAPDHEMTRRALELRYITEVTNELYHSSSDKQYKRSVRKFHNHIVTKLMEHKEKLKSTTSSQQETTQLNNEVDQDRFTRQTEYADEQRASSIECGGVPILPGPQGEAGVRGPPGLPGQNGIRGRPGINGAEGMAGDPGEPGLKGPSGSLGRPGYPGEKGIYGQRGDPGLPGQCSCFKYEIDYHYEPYKHRNTRTLYYPTRYGSKGQYGEKGFPGPKGAPGYRGHPGFPGSPGAKGPKGYRGVNGVTGRTGRSGLTGSKGYAGFRGLPGNAGPPGPPGPPGCACNNLVLYLDRYGFLIDPMNVNTTEIIDELEQVPVNITCIRMEDSPIIGQKGEQGSPGYPGPRGYPGKPGADGNDGYPGQKGAKGEMGYTGQKGFQGSRGPRGKPGHSGSSGPKGYPGNNEKCVLNPEEKTYHSTLVPAACPEGCSNGHKGSRGEQGPKGPRGYPGYRGPPGYPGSKGPRGIAGSPGNLGNEGFAGSPGHRGLRGRRGLPGAPGPAGPQGPPGPTDGCPEYDAVDFNVFFRPTPEEMMMIEQLFATASMDLAVQQMEATYPYLRELAGFVFGEEFPPPTDFCAVVINTTTVGRDLITIEFRGTGPFTCQLDSQPPVPCTSPITYSRSELRAGFHTVNITGGNNTCAETTNFTLPVELVISPPVVDCDEVTVFFSSNGRTQCQLDRRYFTDCKSPYRQSGLRGGKHTVTIRATDGRGQYIQDSVTFNIILDKPQWGAWNEWSACSRSCGTGQSYRKRACLPAECPDPYYQRCNGNSYEGRKCNEKCCPEKPQWSSWTYWSTCSKSCGGGIQYRKRQCIPSKCPYSDPENNKCHGPEYEERKCNEQCCYEKPQWGEWKDWSACSRSCGGGLTYRRRECYQSKCPHPYYKTCHGNNYERKRCNEQCCPKKPYWGSWSYWSACSKSCGGGISFRKRHCYRSTCPHPVYKNCTGNDYEEKKCNDRCCPASIKFIGTPQVYDDSVKISYISSLPTECSLDQGSYEYCKSPYQQSNLKPGAHTLVVKTTECHGQNSVHFYVSDSRSYYKAEPKVYQPSSLEIKIAGVKQYQNCVWIRFTVSHYASTLCSFDNKRWTYCSSPVSSCGLEPGQHTISIKATDRTSQTATANYKFNVY